jgi:DNA repair protein RadD
VTFIGGGPGITVEAVLAHAPVGYSHELLGEKAVALLNLIDGGTAPDTRIRSVAASSVDFTHLLADESSRSEFLRHMPTEKLAELGERLNQAVPAGAAPGPGPAIPELWTPSRLRALLGFVGLVVERAPDEAPPDRAEVQPAYGLFEHQRRAAKRIQTLLYAAERRVVLHLPTGVGKTRTAMHIVATHLRDRGPTLVTWLAHGKELLDQAASEFETAWSSIGDRPVTIGRAWGDRPLDVPSLSDGLVVVSLEKAHAARRRDRAVIDQLALATTLTVFDEAHQSIAPTYRRILDTLTLRPDSSLLGLTATPGRTWANISQDEELAEFYARQKVTLEIAGHKNPVTALIEEGFLARPTFRTVATDAGLDLSAEDRAEIVEEFDLPEHILRRLTEDTQWNLKIVQTVLDLIECHQRVLVFAGSVEHCRLLTAIVSSLGVDCDYVSATTGPRRRDQAISRFKGRSRRPMVLFNYGVLTTGFDAPAASAAIIGRPTKSLVLYSQMVGRVIRGPKAGGTETCEIVTVIDPGLPGFGSVAQAFENWEDVWQTP